MLPLEYFYNEKPLASILSFDSLTRKFRITIDTYLYLYISVHLNGGTSIAFKQYSGGLYCYDTTNMEHNNINS